MRHENRVKFFFPTFLIVISFSHLACAQVNTPSKVTKIPLVVNNVADYRKSILSDESKQLVLLKSFVPQIVIELKYAGKDNFTHTILYRNPTAFSLLPVAVALKNINEELLSLGLTLKVFDAYRPYQITKKLWKHVHNEKYAANPSKGSDHNRGAAVDITLVNLSTKKDLPMPTSFDDFSEKAHHDYKDLPEEVIKNRKLLKDIMEKHGFSALRSEWWHYYLPNAARRFPLLDVSFKQLQDKERK